MGTAATRWGTYGIQYSAEGYGVKAAIFSAPGEPLVLVNVADPSPGPGEVVVKVARCGICGSDLHITEYGTYCPPSGTILGHEYSGEVVAIGTNVTGIAAGERVAVLPAWGCGHCHECLTGNPVWCDRKQIGGGGFAELVAVRPSQCIKLPATVSLADGALVEPLAVGLHAARVANIGAGDSVLVIGAGPIGLAAAFWAVRLGANRVVVSARTLHHADTARALGAHSLLDPEEPFVDAVKKAFGGKPNIVLECVGKPGLIDQAATVVRPRGTIVLVGLCMTVDPIATFQLLIKELRIQASMMYSVRDFREAADVLDSTDALPRVLVSQTIPLSELPTEFEMLRRQTGKGKVLVQPEMRG